MAKEEKKKKHRFLRWLIRVLVFLLLIAAILLGLAYYFLYDKTDGTSSADKTRSDSQVMNEVMAKGFDDISTTKMAKYSFTKADLDQLLYLNIDSNQSLSGIVDKSYVEINGSNYKFYVQAKYWVAKTRVCIDTTLTTDKDNRQFVFSVNDISVGKIKGAYKMLSTVASKLISTDSFNSLFASMGFNMTADLANNKITYTFDNMSKDIINLIGTSSDLGTTLTPFVSFLFENNLVGTDDTSDDLSFYMDFTDTASNSTYMDATQIGKTGGNLSLGDIPSNVNALIDDGNITSDNSNLVFTYLVKGYSAMSESEKSTIASLNLPSSVLENKKYDEYEGIGNAQEVSSIDIEAAKNLTVSGAMAENTLAYTYLTESYLNSTLSSYGLVGTSMVMNGTVDGKSHLTYIVIDDIYTNIVDNRIYYIIRLNINGYLTSMIYSTALDTYDASNFTFSFKQESIYLGTIKANDGIADVFFKYLSQAMDNIASNDSNWIVLNDADKTINFNMKNTIDDLKSSSAEFSTLVSSCGMYPSIEQMDDTDPLASDGRIYLNFKTQA